MSLQTWKDEFYPKEPKMRMTKRQAIEHSLRKWEGLLPKNLEKHMCYVVHKSIRDEDGDDLRINGSSCALCVKYFDGLKTPNCTKCPLFESLGHPCDSTVDAPYYVWIDTKNPILMINALKELLK